MGKYRPGKNSNNTENKIKIWEKNKEKAFFQLLALYISGIIMSWNLEEVRGGKCLNHIKK